MNVQSISAGLVIIAILLLPGCASTAQVEERRAEKKSSIEAILSETSEYTESQRCLSPNEFRNIRILDSEHLLFEGRGERMWLNTLPMRCPGLRKNSVLLIERFSRISSLCRLDSFEVHEWFDSPWYRRWPWRWAGGPTCSLGEFQPVNALQVRALEDAIKAARN